jgi:anti-sigma factor RsiW
MMDNDTQLKLQAYLDGELAPGEARDVGCLLERDEQAKALVAELEGTGRLLAGFEEPMKLPESRDFFWSKIERQIQFEGRPERPPANPSFLSRWRRFLVPATSLAALALAGLFAALGPSRSSSPEFEAALSDPGALTYRDYASGTTLVWLSYPAENEFADETPPDTLP